MNIEYWRTEIDEIDRELLRLLNRRARLAMKVGVLKTAAGLPCCDPEREQRVLDGLQQANPGPLDHDAVTKLFRRIIRESRRMETLAPSGDIEPKVEPLKLSHESLRAPRLSTMSSELRAGEGVLV